METIHEEVEGAEEWQTKCLQQLRSNASYALSEVISSGDRNKDGKKPAEYGANTRGETPSVSTSSASSPPGAAAAAAAGAGFSSSGEPAPQIRTRRYTTSLAGARNWIRKSRKQRPAASSGSRETAGTEGGSGEGNGGGGRSRAYTTAAPSDTARQVSAISVEFQQLIDAKLAQLRAEKERGQLSDEQLEEQFMADIGAALRQIADQFREMNQKKAAEEKQQKARNGSKSGRGGQSKFMQAVRSASGRMIGLFTSV